MRSMLSRLNDRQKAEMLEHIVDKIVMNANQPEKLPCPLDEFNGSFVMSMLKSNHLIVKD